MNDKEILVSVNEDIYHAMDDEILDILLETSIESINIKIDSGKISIKKPTLQTYPSIVNKYGVTKVGRACQVEDLYEEQKEDELDVQ
jgi:predicted solute-binding protein